MSRPRIMLLIFLFAALAAGLCTSGCNPDTRELLLEPRLPVATPLFGGTWTKSPVLTCGNAMNGIAAWGRDDALLIGDYGLAVRVQRGEARNVDVPSPIGLEAVVVQPDGPAWVAAQDGTIYRLDGEEWSVDYRSAVHVRALWRSADGVIIGVGNGGYGVRRAADGTWTSYNTGVGETLFGLWGRSPEDCWAVGSGGVVAHFDGAAWSAERPFGDDVSLDAAICGDADGRVAVVAASAVRLREEGVWRQLPQLAAYGYADGVIFADGQFKAWDSRHLYRWDGTSWNLEAETDEEIWIATAAEGGLLFTSSRGSLVREADGRLETVFPYLGPIDDLETTPDGTVILTANNWIIRETATGWRPEVKLAGANSYHDRGRRLVCDAAGRLLALTDVLYGESAAGWEPLTPVGALGSSPSLFPLDDGTLLIQDATGVSIWTGDRRALLCAPPADWGRLDSVTGDSLQTARYLFPDRLASFDGVTFREVAVGKLPNVNYLAHDPLEGLLLFGGAGLFMGEGATTLDITPRFEESWGLERVIICDFAVTPAGDWLAWTRWGRLLRRRAGLWQSLDGAGHTAFWLPVGMVYPAAPGRSIRTADGGDILLFSDSQVYRYRDAAP
ncbi:MAG: hypothetical protein ACYDIE_10165 [Candidatus Krumholzibacteriia bacterium]